MTGLPLNQTDARVINDASDDINAQAAADAWGNEERIVPLRLQKFLARAGVASRRGSENLMTAGRVKVNGVVVTELGSKVNPLVDQVMVDDVVVDPASAPATIMLHKPAGFLTTMSDPQGRPTVASLVPTKEYPGLYPVGRLDGDTTGLLLFTTDGELGHRLLHPSHHVHKTYLALVQGIPSSSALKKLTNGVLLDDGMTAPASVELLTGDNLKRVLPVFEEQSSLSNRLLPWHQKAGSTAFERGISEKLPKNTSVVRLTIHEGRTHQVKRMMSAVGNPVVRLHRESFGSLGLGNLERGVWRELTDDEVGRLTENGSC